MGSVLPINILGESSNMERPNERGLSRFSY